LAQQRVPGATASAVEGNYEYRHTFLPAAPPSPERPWLGARSAQGPSPRDDIDTQLSFFSTIASSRSQPSFWMTIDSIIVAFAFASKSGSAVYDETQQRRTRYDFTTTPCRFKTSIIRFRL